MQASVITSLTSFLTNLFRFAPVSATVIENVIMSSKIKININDTDSEEVLKDIIYLVSPMLAHINNLSLSTGCFPKSSKKSRVVPICKSGSKTDVNDYRPISILHTLS